MEICGEGGGRGIYGGMDCDNKRGNDGLREIEMKGDRIRM